MCWFHYDILIHGKYFCILSICRSKWNIVLWFIRSNNKSGNVGLYNFYCVRFYSEWYSICISTCYIKFVQQAACQFGYSSWHIYLLFASVRQSSCFTYRLVQLTEFDLDVVLWANIKTRSSKIVSVIVYLPNSYFPLDSDRNLHCLYPKQPIAEQYKLWPRNMWSVTIRLNFWKVYRNIHPVKISSFSYSESNSTVSNIFKQKILQQCSSSSVSWLS